MKVLLICLLFGVNLVIGTRINDTKPAGEKFICNTCFDVGYWQSDYTKSTRLLDLNLDAFSECPNLRSLTTGTRHRCDQQCTYAVRMPSLVKTSGSNFEIPMHQSLGCGDLYKDFNEHPFEREPCSMIHMKDGQSELLCKCSSENCNRRIARWALRNMDEWRVENEKGDLVMWLYNRQDSIWEVDESARATTSALIHSTITTTTSTTTTTSRPSTTTRVTKTTRGRRIDPIIVKEATTITVANSTASFVPEPMDEYAESRPFRSYLYYAVIVVVLSLLFLLIVLIAFCKYRHGNDFEDKLLAEKKKKAKQINKKCKGPNCPSTYKMNDLQWIDSDVPPEPSPVVLIAQEQIMENALLDERNGMLKRLVQNGEPLLETDPRVELTPLGVTVYPSTFSRNDRSNEDHPIRLYSSPESAFSNLSDDSPSVAEPKEKDYDDEGYSNSQKSPTYHRKPVENCFAIPEPDQELVETIERDAINDGDSRSSHSASLITEFLD